MQNHVFSRSGGVSFAARCDDYIRAMDSLTFRLCHMRCQSRASVFVFFRLIQKTGDDAPQKKQQTSQISGKPRYKHNGGLK